MLDDGSSKNMNNKKKKNNKCGETGTKNKNSKENCETNNFSESDKIKLNINLKKCEKSSELKDEINSDEIKKRIIGEPSNFEIKYDDFKKNCDFKDKNNFDSDFKGCETSFADTTNLTNEIQHDSSCFSALIGCIPNAIGLNFEILESKKNCSLMVDREDLCDPIIKSENMSVYMQEKNTHTEYIHNKNCLSEEFISKNGLEQKYDTNNENQVKELDTNMVNSNSDTENNRVLEEYTDQRNIIDCIKNDILNNKNIIDEKKSEKTRSFSTDKIIKNITNIDNIDEKNNKKISNSCFSNEDEKFYQKKRNMKDEFNDKLDNRLISDISSERGCSKLIKGDLNDSPNTKKCVSVEEINDKSGDSISNVEKNNIFKQENTKVDDLFIEPQSMNNFNEKVAKNNELLENKESKLQHSPEGKFNKNLEDEEINNTKNDNENILNTSLKNSNINTPERETTYRKFQNKKVERIKDYFSDDLSPLEKVQEGRNIEKAKRNEKSNKIEKKLEDGAKNNTEAKIGIKKENGWEMNEVPNDYSNNEFNNFNSDHETKYKRTVTENKIYDQKNTYSNKNEIRETHAYFHEERDDNRKKEDFYNLSRNSTNITPEKCLNKDDKKIKNYRENHQKYNDAKFLVNHSRFNNPTKEIGDLNGSIHSEDRNSRIYDNNNEKHKNYDNDSNYRTKNHGNIKFDDYNEMNIYSINKIYQDSSNVKSNQINYKFHHYNTAGSTSKESQNNKTCYYKKIVFDYKYDTYFTCKSFDLVRTPPYRNNQYISKILTNNENLYPKNSKITESISYKKETEKYFEDKKFHRKDIKPINLDEEANKLSLTRDDLINYLKKRSNLKHKLFKFCNYEFITNKKYKVIKHIPNEKERLPYVFFKFLENGEYILYKDVIYRRNMNSRLEMELALGDLKEEDGIYKTKNQNDIKNLREVKKSVLDDSIKEMFKNAFEKLEEEKQMKYQEIIKPKNIEKDYDKKKVFEEDSSQKKDILLNIDKKNNKISGGKKENSVETEKSAENKDRFKIVYHDTDFSKKDEHEFYQSEKKQRKIKKSDEKKIKRKEMEISDKYKEKTTLKNKNYNSSKYKMDKETNVFPVNFDHFHFLEVKESSRKYEKIDEKMLERCSGEDLINLKVQNYVNRRVDRFSESIKVDEGERSIKKSKNQIKGKICEDKNAKNKLKRPLCDVFPTYNLIEYEESSSYEIRNVKKKRPNYITRLARCSRRKKDYGEYNNNTSIIEETIHESFICRKPQVEQRKSKIHGTGTFALEKIGKNIFLGEYSGEIIGKELSDIREQKYKLMNKNETYFFKIDKDMVVDATRLGNGLRFLNHSCKSNCEAEIRFLSSTKKRVYIFSSREIETGEELTLDYGFEREEGVERVPCNCGEEACKKFLDYKEKTN